MKKFEQLLFIINYFDRLDLLYCNVFYLYNMG